MKINRGGLQLVCITSAMIAGLLSVYTVPLEIGALTDGLNVGEDKAGLIGTLEIFTLAIGSLVLPKWLSRWPLRTVALNGIFIVTLAQLLSAITTHHEILLLIRCISGLGSALLLASANSIIATSETPEVLYGKVFSVLSAVYAILLTLLPYGLRFGEQHGFFVAQGIFVILLMPFIFKLTKNSYNNSSPDYESKPVPLLSVSLLFISITALYLVMGGAYSFFERIGAGIGIHRETLGITLGISTVAGIAGAFSASWLGLRVGRMFPAISGFLMTGLMCSLIVVSTDPGIFIISIIVYGFMNQFILPYLLGIASALDNSGRIATATMGYLLIPYSLGPAIFGSVGMETMAEYGWLGFAVCLAMVFLLYPLIKIVDGSEASCSHIRSGADLTLQS